MNMKTNQPALLCGMLLLAADLINAAVPAELPPVRLAPKSADAAPERRAHPQPTVPDGAREISFDETAPEPTHMVRKSESQRVHAASR